MQRPKLTMQSLGNERNRYSSIKEKTLTQHCKATILPLKKKQNKTKAKDKKREKSILELQYFEFPQWLFLPGP